MPVGTVRGRFELDAPALRTLKDLEKQGIRTQAQMKALGETMDSVGGSDDVRRLQTYNQQLAEVRRTADRTARDVSANWVGMTRAVRTETARQTRAIDGLLVKMRQLGSVTARPNVDMSGITVALAQVEMLESRLNALGRSRATPNVSIGGGFGGGRVPNGGGGRGGFGGGGLRSVGFGPLNFGSRTGLALMGASLPVATALVGGATSLLGSAASGALGAGALGIGAFGAGAAGLGGTAAVAAPAFSKIGETNKAQQQYDQAVARYGRGSTQARGALANLQVAYSQSPEGTRGLLRSKSQFTSGWDRATQAGQRSVVGASNNVLRAGIRATPAYSRAANRSTAATAEQVTNLANFAAGATGRRGARVGSGIYAGNIGNVEQTLEAAATTFINVMQAARPFIKESSTWLRDWVRGWADSTGDISKTRDSIGNMVDDLKSWGRLGGAGFDLLKSLLGSAAPAGTSMVDKLTATFDRWDAWVKANPAKVEGFFTRTTDSVEKMATALTQIVGSLGEIGTALLPLLDRFSDLAALAGGVGLGTPGVAGLAYGAFQGFRGRGGGRGGRGPGGAAGGGGGGMGAADALALAAAGGGAAGAHRGARGVAGAAGAARRTTFIAGPGGVVTPATARTRAGVLSRSLGRTRIGGAVSGAARGYLPIAALMAVAQGYGATQDPGGYGGSSANNFLQGAGSALTMGMIPGVQSQAQQRDAAAAANDPLLSGLSGSYQSRVAAINAEITKLKPQTTRNTKSVLGLESGGLVSGLLGGGDRTSADAKVYAERVKLLREERDALIQVNAAQATDLRGRRDAKSVQNAMQYGAGLGGAYNVYRKQGGKSAVGAGMAVESDFRKHMGGIRDAGVQTLGQAGLDWANALAKKNPEMQAVVDRMTADIKHRFRTMGQNVQVINGQILTGSKEEWGKISEAIGGAAEKAKERTSAAFTAIQEQAVGSLVAMGFSRGEAKNLVQSIESGGKTGAVAKQVAGGQAGYTALERAQGTNRSGPGMRTGDGWGKRWGDGVGNAGMGGGGNSVGLMGANPGLERYAKDAARFGLSVTSGLRPGSITNAGNVSYHSSGNALDLSNGSGPTPQMMEFAQFMAQNYGSQLEELIYTPLGYSIKNGQKVAPYAQADHMNHVHIADTAPGGKGGGIGGGQGVQGGGMASVNLKSPRSGLSGAPGAMADRAAMLYSKGLQKKLNGALGGAGGVGGYSGKGAMSFNQVARLAESVGLPGITFAQIAKGESAFIPTAVGHDPGGTQGLGLWQITTGFNDDIIARFGGREAMFNPRINARAAKAIYDRQGIQAWYGTRYLTDSNAHFQGDGWGYAGAFANGGSFMAGRPTMFMAGERKHGSMESVSVRRVKPRTAHRALAAAGGVNLNFNAPVHVRSDADLDKLADVVGKKLLHALNGDQVPDSDIDGGG